MLGVGFGWNREEFEDHGRPASGVPSVKLMISCGADVAGNELRGLGHADAGLDAHWADATASVLTVSQPSASYRTGAFGSVAMVRSGSAGSR